MKDRPRIVALLRRRLKTRALHSLGGHAEVLLYKVEGHSQGHQGDDEVGRDGGNDANGRQAKQGGSRQRLQRRRNVLEDKENQRQEGWDILSGTRARTWSIMLVSAENLLRICPRGVMSKNLTKERELNPRRVTTKKQSADKGGRRLPERSVDDLVEQVVVYVGGCRETQELHGERGDEAQRDASRAQDHEHRQVKGVLQTRTLQNL